MSGPMAEAQAEAVWQILVEMCGARSDHGFIHHQTSAHVTEWRFGGLLGFGGKFWRTSGHRPDGTWGEQWRVDCYIEDETPERRAIIDAANERLWQLQQVAA